MEITSRQQTELEKLISQGYRERGRTLDEQWVTLENSQEGIVYDIKQEKIRL